MHLRNAVVAGILALLVAVLCDPASPRAPRRYEPCQPVQVVKVVKERGFSWRDAGIGAAATGFGVAVVAGGSLLFVRVQRPPTTRT